MKYIVTGGTGFIGRRIVSRILQTQPNAHIAVLVRRESLARFEKLARQWDDRVQPLVGDLTQPNLGLAIEGDPITADHIVHCAAVYDVTADENSQRAANVEGTRSVIALARQTGATLHHMSSIAVAGTYDGEFTEEDFDVNQDLPSPYHQTKFESELLVRSEPGLRYRIYRPAVVVGDSRTGEMDKVDGPYYFFGILAKLGRLPRLAPVVLPKAGRSNIVPVDYVVDATVELMHQDGRDGRTFHLTNPTTTYLRDIYSGIADAAGLKPVRGALPHAFATPFLKARGKTKVWRNMVVTQLGIPPEILDITEIMPTFISDETRKALGPSGITVPDFESYAGKLYAYWRKNLDPERYRRDDPAGPLVGRHVIITGASSGIGRATALAVAERGGIVFAIARDGEALDGLVAEIREDGGTAYAFPCDLTDYPMIDDTVKRILGEFGHVDYLVNNAGRSIRRSVVNTVDRFHDYERVMAVNYFGAVRMVLALLPHWRKRKFGHVVNVSTIGVQTCAPKYASYVPSKAALDAFSDVVASEVVSDHITFTNIHMPLVKTPMIAPSQKLDVFPGLDPEHAAAMVIRGLIEKPPRIDHPMGTAGEIGRYMNPKMARFWMHQMYLAFPDSRAARGLAPVDTRRDNSTSRRRPRAAKRVAAAPKLQIPGPVKKAVRSLPGVHW